MDITNQHWECFRLGNQEKKPLLEVAETLGIDVRQVKQMLTELRKAEPGLFPYEREYLEFGKQHQNRDGKKLLRLEDIDENEIKHKY